MNEASQTFGPGWHARLCTAASSLKLRITLGVIAALVAGIGLTTAALLHRAERDTLTNQHERELDEAVRAARMLSRRVVELQRALRSVAGQLDRATMADDARLAAFMQTKPVLLELFSSLSVASVDGQMRTFIDETGTQRPKLNIADRDYFRRTVKERLAVVSAPLPSRLSGQPVILLTHPLENADGVFGVLAGALRLSSRDLLSDVVDARAGGDSDVLLVVTDAQGRILAHPDRDRLLNAADDPQAGWPEGGGEIGRLARVLRHVGAERAQLESFNAAVLGKLSSVMAAAPVGIAFTRAQHFDLVSEEFCRLFQRAEHELLGQPVQVIFGSNADYQTFEPRVQLAFEAGEAYVGEWQMLRADGTLFWARLCGRPVDAGDAESGTSWTLNDIDHQVAERARLEWSATHDVLTGLANRKELEQRLERVFRALPRSMPAAVVVIDLDHFKPINDTAGHAAGDSMLKSVASAITSHVRAGDLVVRLGGDEFALLLERCPHDVAMRVAENVRSAISAIALPWGSQTFRIGASVGVASLTEHLPDVAAWLAEADVACYRAKADGRGSVRAAVQPLLRVVGGRTLLND